MRGSGDKKDNRGKQETTNSLACLPKVYSSRPYSCLLNAISYNESRILGLWLRWIEQAPPELSGTLEETP